MIQDRRVTKVLVTMIAGLLLMGHPYRAAGQEPPPSLDAVVDRVVQRFLLDNDVPGAAVGIVRNGTLLYAKGYGVRSVERHEPVVANTLFQIGSLTKVFTTTLMLQLRDEGRLALDTPVSQYLPAQVVMPSWREGEERLLPTLRHLATHRAGLPRNPPNRRDRPHSPSVMEPYSIAELYQGLAMTTLTSRPGTAVHYSNMGFMLLGHVLERVTGQPYEVLLHEKLLAPLAIEETKISLTAADLARFAAHYWPRGQRVERERWMFGEVAAFAGVASTVPDLARFVAMHLGAQGGPLHSTSVLEMREPVATVGTAESRGVTMGWFFTEHPKLGRIVSHTGEVDGHSASLWLAPQVNTAIIVLANVGSDTAPRLQEVIKVVLGYGP